MAFRLTWRVPVPTPAALPNGIKRSFIPTTSGPLELLSATPSTPTRKSPLVFAHGGFGSAAVWLEYMSYFSSHGIPCHAVSVRGHGNSWYPSFLRMVYWTTKRQFADDLVAAVKYVQRLGRDRHGDEEEKKTAEVVLVGHSSGGGLSQIMLSAGDVKVKGLVLVGSIPCFGSTGVYFNWLKADPWLSIRMLWHFWHPKSVLSSTSLVQNIFFGSLMPEEKVPAFEKLLSPYESLIWPLGMLRPFVNVTNILQQISGWGSLSISERVMVLAGGEDKLMTRSIMRSMAGTYRSALKELVAAKKVKATIMEEVKATEEEDDVGQGVRFAVVPFAGHHMQNDVPWEVGAKKILNFYEQL